MFTDDNDNNMNSGGGATPTAGGTPAGAPVAPPDGGAAPATSGAAPVPAPAPAVSPASAPARQAEVGGEGTVVPDHGNIGGKVLNSILGALGGTSATTYERDPKTGKMVVSTVKDGPGQAAKRILAGALTGLAAGAGAKPGAGQSGRAFSAGFQKNTERLDQQDEAARSNADQDYKFQQAKLVQNAQAAHLNQQIFESNDRANRENAKWHLEYDQSANQFAESMQRQNAQDFGTYDSWADFVAKHKDHPEFIGQMNTGMDASGNPTDQRARVFHAPDGKIHVWLVDVAKAKQLNSEPRDLTRYSLDKDGKVTSRIERVAAGAYPNEVLDTAQQAEEDKKNKWMEKRSEEAAKAKSAEQVATIHANGTVQAARIHAATQTALASGKTSAETKLLEGDAVKASNAMRPMVTLLNSAEDYYRKGKFDSAGDLGLIINAVRSMNPGTVRLPNKELELELQRGTYGEQWQRFVKSRITDGTLPPKFRDELMGVIRRETTHGAELAAQNWQQVFGQRQPLPVHLSRFGKTAPEAAEGGGANAPAGATAEVHDASGKLLGHVVNNKYVALGGQ